MNQINTQTLALKRALAETISAAALPPCVVGLVLDKLRGEVSALEAQAIAREARKAQTEAQEEAEE